jgi:hypothetical protein
MAQLGQKDISIFANFEKLLPNGSEPTSDKAIMYVKFTIDYYGDGTNIREYKTFITSDVTAGTCAILSRGPDCQNELLLANKFTTNSGLAWKYSDKLILDFFNKIGAQFINSSSKITLTLKPLYYDAYIGISTAACLTPNACNNNDKGIVMPGPFTNIQSTGYYGGVTRTISANIDRQSGTLYDLFDYVIFEKQ